MARTTGGTPKARALGAELREVREAIGKSLRAMARDLDTNHVKLGRYETGETVPSSEFVAAYLAALGVSSAERDRIVGMAHDATSPDWLSAGRAGLRHELTTLIEFERTATAITDVATELVPGLLQTSDYARAIMAGMPAGEVEKHVLMRVGRREILTGRRAPTFTAILAEHAIREPIGGYAVMGEQLRQVVDMAEDGLVDVRVLPSGLTEWHPARMGAFALFEFPKATPIVHLEHYQSGAFLHNEHVTRAYVEAVTTLQQVAMTPEESAKFIVNCAAEMEESG